MPTPRLILSLFTPMFLLTALASPGIASDASGRKLLNALGCKGCHRFEASGGTIGPVFDDIGDRLSEADIEAQLRHPEKNNLKSLMPAYGHLSGTDIKAVAEFLAKQKK